MSSSVRGARGLASHMRRPVASAPRAWCWAVGSRASSSSPPPSSTSLYSTSPSSPASSSAPTTPSSPSTPGKPKRVTVLGQTYDTDRAWFNVPHNVLDATSRRLHLQHDHPMALTRQLLESHFPQPTFNYYNEYHPVVTAYQNFDSLGFPAVHPGRNLSDTYYLDEATLLRTHTSAHEADTFRKNTSGGYLISADVYRRDAIDRSHYPVFHQMEGARSWDRTVVPGGDVAAAVWADVERLPKHNVVVEDPNPPFHAERNPVQHGHHSEAEAEAISAHLKRSLEAMVADVFSRARAAALRDDPGFPDEPLRMRWVEAYFPFTSPSYELEVFYDGDWLEVLGCGVTKQDLYINAGVPHRCGWTFGIGLDRIAMLLFKVSDIRIFWSEDERFLSQFRGLTGNMDSLRRFKPFSKHPPCPKDVSFWLPAAATSASAAGGNLKGAFHENDVMEVVRSAAGDIVEDVRLIDEFRHPKTGRRSMAYRIVYRSLENTLTHLEANALHDKVTAALVSNLGVEVR